MRFVRLEVRDFRGIESAEVDFEAGVNVLHGPNDLGKSTLAAAIRAALLIPATSAQADDFAPWHRDRRPEVELTFVGPKDRYWKVKKQFSRTKGTGIHERFHCVRVQCIPHMRHLPLPIYCSHRSDGFGSSVV